MPVLDLADFMDIDINGLVFKTSETSRMYETLYSIDSDTTPRPVDEKYIFYSAAPEIINAIALSTPMLILDTGRTINYVGIGYATEQSFNGASDLEEDEESDFITFNGSCTCVIIDIMVPITYSSDNPVTRILIMSDNDGSQSLSVDDPQSKLTPVG